MQFVEFRELRVLVGGELGGAGVDVAGEFSVGVVGVFEAADEPAAAGLDVVDGPGERVDLLVVVAGGPLPGRGEQSVQGGGSASRSWTPPSRGTGIENRS